jgi:uncharacterized membrane protein YkvA (DUF1232 family)
MRRLAGTVRRLPRYARLGRALMADPHLERRRKVVLGAGLAYVASPIDLVPGIVPVVGQLDDLAAVLLGLRYALDGCRPEVADAHLRRAGLSRAQLDQDLASVGSAARWFARGAARGSRRAMTATARGLVRVTRAGVEAWRRRQDS